MKDVLPDVPFRVHLERRPDGGCVVVVTGEADLHAAPQLDRCIRECENGEVRQVVVDLTGATLLDSTALGILIAAHSRLGEKQIPLTLACTDRLIRRALTVTGLDRVFTVHASTTEALDHGASVGARTPDPLGPGGRSR